MQHKVNPFVKNRARACTVEAKITASDKLFLWEQVSFEIKTEVTKRERNPLSGTNSSQESGMFAMHWTLELERPLKFVSTWSQIKIDIR